MGHWTRRETPGPLASMFSGPPPAMPLELHPCCFQERSRRVLSIAGAGISLPFAYGVGVAFVIHAGPLLGTKVAWYVVMPVVDNGISTQCPGDEQCLSYTFSSTSCLFCYLS